MSLHLWTGRLIATCMVCCEKCIASLKREYDEHYHVIWPSIGNLGSDFSRSYVGWQFRLVVCCILCCVLCAVCSTLTILSHSTQHSTQPPHHRIAHLAHLYSIAYWDPIDFGCRTQPQGTWYLWNSHLHCVSCLTSAESVACWFFFDTFLMTCLTRWQNNQWKLNPTILSFTAFVKISFSGCWLYHPQLHKIVG